MSFMKKVKVSLGFGAAKVNAVFDADTYVQGDIVTGTVFLEGGDIDQIINGLFLDIMTKVIKEGGEHVTIQEAVLSRYTISDEFTIRGGEQKEIPFSFQLPFGTPVSVGNKDVWIRTKVDIAMAVDPKDYDYIQVLPHPTLKTVWDALQGLEFLLYKSKNVPLRFSPIGIGQELEFINRGAYQKYLDELEVIPLLDETGGTFLFEVDRKARGVGGFLAEAFEMDESKAKLSLKHEEAKKGVAAVQQRIKVLLQKYV